MLKFFKNIRQKMIMENRIGNYLKYAFGEIILVMIGILLALQVNQWVITENKAKKREALKTSLLYEVNSVRSLAWTCIINMEKQKTLILYLVNNEVYDPDSITSLTTRDWGAINPLDILITHITHFNPRTNVYNTAVNDGSLALLEDPQLIKDLGTTFLMSQHRMVQYEITEENINNSLREYISTEYKDLFVSGNLTGEGGYGWDEVTTQKFLDQVSQDGTLKYLLSTKMDLLTLKYGTFRYLIMRQMDRAVKLLENNPVEIDDSIDD